MNDRPTVTICIPSYNYAQFLGEAIESVLCQSYTDLELLVFDDGSTDGSLELARSYAASDARIRVLTHDGGANRGASMTSNEAFSAARGTYIASLAADDVLFADSLARRVEVLEADPTLGFVYGSMELLAADGRLTGRIGGLSPEAICAFDRTTDPLVSLLLHNYMPAPSVLIRRELLEQVGAFDDRFYYVDWELWIRLLAHSRAGFVPGPPLAGYRIHGHALTQEDDEADLPRRLDLYRALDEKSASIGGRLAAPRPRALVSLQRAVHAAELGDEVEAGTALRTAFDKDATLGEDVDFLFWWLGLHQQRRLRRPRLASGYGWLRTFTDASAGVTAIVDAGAEEGHFGFWSLRAARGRVSDAMAARLCWALVGNELEAAGADHARLGVLRASFLRLFHSPRLLTERWFVKIILCAGGLWAPVVRTRRSGPQVARTLRRARVRVARVP